MKLVISLCAFQTALLLALLWQSLTEAHDAELPTSITAPAAANYERQVSSSSALPPSIDESRIRQIIREELNSLLNGDYPETQNSPAAAPSSVPPRQFNDSEYAAIKEKLALYKSVGSISESQMRELQSSIVRMDETSRRELMSELVRAINSGELKGLL